MTSLNTTVIASFSEESTGLPEADAQRWLLEESKRPPMFVVRGFPSKLEVSAYFLVFPAADELTFVTSSGSVSSSVPRLQKRVFETLTFQGGDPWVLLKYPKPKEVKIQLSGVLLPAKPPYTDTITVTYDSLRNVVKASRPCFGMVTVEYFAPYDLWLAHFPPRPPATFDQKKVVSPSDPSTYPDPEDEHESIGGHPMLILAKRAFPPVDADPDEIVASLSLNPPGSGEFGDRVTDPTGWSLRFGTESQMPKLKMMVDPKFPVRLLTKTTTAIPQAGCNVLLIPEVGIMPYATAGQFFSGVTAAMAPVSEIVAFSGTPSVSLQHQPANTPSMTIVGTFVNKWGHSTSVIVHPPGSTVRVVEWLNESEPKNPMERTVGADELVITDGLGNTIPAYGIVKVEYAITAKSIEYVFEYDEASKSFKTAWAIALFGDQSATLRLDGPLMKALR